MTADQTIKGKLAEILKSYASMEEDKRDSIAEIMEKRVSVGRQEFFDARSLYHKNIRSRRIDREPLTVEQDGNFLGLAEEYLLQQIKNRYPATRVLAFIESLFPVGNSEVESRDIPVTCDADFIMLILAVIRQNERGMSYMVDINSNERIGRNGYFIPDMVIRKKEVKSHVE